MTDQKMVVTVELDDKMRLHQIMMENKVLGQAEQLRLLQRAVIRRNRTIKNLRARLAEHQIPKEVPNV